MNDESLTTYKILKYGPMIPDRVRDIITTYMEDRDINSYYTEWKPFPIPNKSDSKVMYTHFIRVLVYYDDIYQQVLFELADGIVCVDVTNKDPDEVYTSFHEYYEEIHRICLHEEYKNNFFYDSDEQS